MLLIGDGESDGFKYEATRLWMIVTYCVEEKHWTVSIEEGVELLQYDLDGVLLLSGISNYTVIKGYEEHLAHISKADKVVFHNGIMHDFPLFSKLCPSWKGCRSVDDTFIMSSLFNPDRLAPTGSTKPHSIEAWGMRYGRKKVKNEDWSRFTGLMLHRCIEDVIIGMRTYEALRIEAKGWDWSRSLQLEYMIAGIQAEQEMNGVLFDVEGAHRLIDLIDKEVEEIDSTLLAAIPQRVERVGAVVSKPFKINGQYTKQVEDWVYEEAGM
jgi:hypothetical protein